MTTPPSGRSWCGVIDPKTGTLLGETPLGVGPTADTLQMVGTILPDGALLQGSVSGLSVVRRPAS
jgi:hypothetical protein